MRIKVVLQNYNTTHTEVSRIAFCYAKRQEVRRMDKELSAIESQNYDWGRAFVNIR